MICWLRGVRRVGLLFWIWGVKTVGVDLVVFFALGYCVRVLFYFCSFLERGKNVYCFFL